MSSHINKIKLPPLPPPPFCQDEAFERQKEILRKRRENQGFIGEEEKAEISKRRQGAMAESRILKSIQQNDGADNLEAWKKLKEEGAITTSTSGMVRDEGSSRLGSAGLFAERADEKLPYIDSGYVAEGTEEGGGFFGGIAKLFGGEKK